MPTNPTPVPPFVPPYRPPSFQEADRTDKDISVQKRSYSDQLFEDQYHGQQLETQTADEEFANLWKTIQDRHQGGNLLSFFLSDNGYAWGDHGLWGKGEPYIENSRVPFYVRWPGHFTAGAVDRGSPPTSTSRRPSTKPPGSIPATRVDGHSLLGSWQRQGLLLEFQAHNPVIPPWSSYLAPGERQYVHWSDGFIEDYDLRSDPAEMNASNATGPRPRGEAGCGYGLPWQHVPIRDRAPSDSRPWQNIVPPTIGLDLRRRTLASQSRATSAFAERRSQLLTGSVCAEPGAARVRQPLGWLSARADTTSGTGRTLHQVSREPPRGRFNNRGVVMPRNSSNSGEARRPHTGSLAKAIRRSQPVRFASFEC